MSQPEAFDASQAGFPPQQQRSSGRIWLGMGIGCGAMLLLCCGGFAAISYFSMQQLAKGFSEDPVIARERTAEIATITLPPEFEPKASFEFVIPFQNQRLLSWVLYKAHAPDGTENLIVLGQFYQQLAEATRDQLMQQIHQSLREQQAHEHVAIDDSKTFTREFTIRDQSSEFLFQEGEGTQTDTRYRIVVGQFAGAGGTALLYMQVDPEQYSDEELVEIIESIR